MPKTDNSVGIDLGIKTFTTVGTLHATSLCCCGFKGGKLDLSIREWECLNCCAKHGRVGSGPSIETKMQQQLY